MTKKIALIGSAPSSVKLAPYDDPSWEIWGCSPGASAHVKRVDRWFEIHRWEPDKPWFEKQYIDFMAGLHCPVYMIDHVPEIPGSVPYPKHAILEKYGKYFFTSSLSWMLALALEEKDLEEIGIWGVDMSAQEEWQFQRSGCQYFIQLAKSRGIKVTIPPEADLIQPPVLYGFSEAEPMAIKLTARAYELAEKVRGAEAERDKRNSEFYYFNGQIAENKILIEKFAALPDGDDKTNLLAEQKKRIDALTVDAATAHEHAQKASSEFYFFKGAIDDLDYIRKTWVQTCA